MYKKILKPFFDFSIALLLLIIISPLFVLIILFLFFANQGKPFFLQNRPGKNGKIFTIVKFKTMSDKRDKNGELLPDSERLTRVGNFIRNTSLDELPQLLNILKGDMSFIGPRPLMPQYLPLYNEFQRRRHDVKPGITGWAQVNGRNSVTWEQQFKLDVYYVDNINFNLDFKIILRTLKKVMNRSEIYSDPKLRTFYFEGNDE